MCLPGGAGTTDEDMTPRTRVFNYSTSNIMARGEVGSCPLLEEISKVRYISSKDPLPINHCKQTHTTIASLLQN